MEMCGEQFDYSAVGYGQFGLNVAIGHGSSGYP
jgi:hypothetical protein